MPYTNATFFIDYESGSDAARTALTAVTVANNGTGLVRCTKANHGLVTNAIVDVTLNYAGAWSVTRVDADNFDLTNSAYSTATSVTVTPRGGSSMLDAWKTVSSTGATAARIAAGDTMRLKASPDPTSLAQLATWTDGPLRSSISIASSTNATPIVITLSAGNYSAMAPSVGDAVIVSGHTVNTSANGMWAVSAVNGSTSITLQDALGVDSIGNGAGLANGVIRKINNLVVKLSSAVTKNIALCGNQNRKPNWTASANVVTSVITTPFREGGECQQIAIGAAFTTGLAAYFPVGTLDLSAFGQVSFWMHPINAILAGEFSIKLCTDALGAVPVHSIDLLPTTQTTIWNAVTADMGGALNAGIQSVALYVNADNGAKTIYLDNLIACKSPANADSLTLTSLVSKNTGNESWFGIQSINGTRVVLDLHTNTTPAGSPQRGYSGTTESVATFKRETVKTLMAAGSSSAQSFQRSGVSGSPISYLGGWNRADMTTQTGHTWFDGQNGVSVGLGDVGFQRDYQFVDKINFTRYTSGIFTQAASLYCAIGAMATCNTSGAAISFLSTYGTVTTLSSVQSASAILTGPSSNVTTIVRADACGVSTGANSIVGSILQCNNSAQGIFSGPNSTIGSIMACHNSANNGYTPGSNSTCGYVATSNNLVFGVFFNGSGSNARVLGGVTSGNPNGGVGSNGSRGFLRNFSANDTTPFGVLGSGTGLNALIYSERNYGVADAHLVISDGGTIISATDQRNTASGIAWKFRPTSVQRASAYPLHLSVAKIACAANVAVNVTIFTRRDNANIQGQLYLQGGQLAGLPNDITVSCAPAINTWVQSAALTFTPTEAGVVEVFFRVWDGVGTTNNFWIDDLAVT